MPNLLKISLDIRSDFRNGFFGTLHIDLKVESNLYDHYQQSCQKMHLLLPAGSSMRGVTHNGGNCAVERESVVKVATPACSPYV